MKRNKFVRDNILGEEEFRQLMRACELTNNPLVDMFLMGIVPGLRASEIAHIKEIRVDQNSKGQNKLGGVE